MSEVIRVGDHYEITLRGRWNDTYDTTTDHIEDLVLANLYESDESDTVFVKKIEPPVEVFKPGDRIRRKWSDTTYEVTLGNNGYLHHLPSGNVTFSGYDNDPKGFFSSENFEKVYPA